MAVGHISFTNTQLGGQLQQALHEFNSGLDALNELFATMTQMKDGDGSQASHFTYAVSKFGFPDTTAAKAAYDELGSVLAKLNTDASVSNVHAAIGQLIAKFRN